MTSQKKLGRFLESALKSLKIEKRGIEMKNNVEAIIGELSRRVVFEEDLLPYEIKGEIEGHFAEIKPLRKMVALWETRGVAFLEKAKNAFLLLLVLVALGFFFAVLEMAYGAPDMPSAVGQLVMSPFYFWFCVAVAVVVVVFVLLAITRFVFSARVEEGIIGHMAVIIALTEQRNFNRMSESVRTDLFELFEENVKFLDGSFGARFVK